MPLPKGIAAILIAAISASIATFVPALAQDSGLESFFSPVQKMIAPEFKNEKERAEYVLKVMQRVQSAALRYASHHKGELPKKVDNAFMSYMIFGECDDKTFTSFSVPLNPYTGKRHQILVGKVADPAVCRKSAPTKMAPGSVEYSIAASGKDFTVRGGVGTGKAMADPKNKRQTYVLSADPASQVKANMRTVQWAAELYKEEHHAFPKAIDDEFKYFFPWGDRLKKKFGNALPNPYTGKLEYPVLGKMKSPIAERLKAPGPVPPGIVEYCSTDAQTNYCVRGGDGNGKAIEGMSGPKSTMILAKDGDGTGHGHDSR